MVFAKTGMKFLIQLFHFFCRKKTFSFSKNLVSLKNEKSFLLSSVFIRKFRRFSPVFANTLSVARNTPKMCIKLNVKFLRLQRNWIQTKNYWVKGLNSFSIKKITKRNWVLNPKRIFGILRSTLKLWIPNFVESNIRRSE